ncbi:MAG: 4Fe-4S ferredoxin [Candidatus Altiarchaeales archaeon A3]|nr:MAG: 4Fe-4S ferredoxin [Candidatus Altiarchaeales archaeon A3]
MVTRNVIKIDEEKCNGCGLCIPNCSEGALQIIDGKVRLISDLLCDGLGACIGHCPKGAITIEEREAEPYDERKVMENVVWQGKNVIKAHLEHLKKHNEVEYLNEAIEFLKEKDMENPLGKESEHKENIHLLERHGCPGAEVKNIIKNPVEKHGVALIEQESELSQWPVQLNLLPPNASFFKNSDLLIAADCVPFANPNFHSNLLKGKSLAIGCPKLDNIENYKEKIKAIIEMNDLNTITVAIMEVPCCYSLYKIVENALNESGKRISLKKAVVEINGNIKK